MGLPKVDVTKLVQGLVLLKDDVKELDATDIPDNPSIWWKLVHLDPALYRGLVMAIVAIAASLGFLVSDHAIEAIVSGISIFMFLVQAFWTRKAVTPNAKVVVYKPDPVEQPARVAPGDAVSTNAVAVINAAAQNKNTGPVPVIPTFLLTEEIK